MIVSWTAIEYDGVREFLGRLRNRGHRLIARWGEEILLYVSFIGLRLTKNKTRERVSNPYQPPYRKVCLFVCLFVCLGKTRKSILRSLCLEGSNNPWEWLHTESGAVVQKLIRHGPRA